MSATHPDVWARSKRVAMEASARSDVARWSRTARDVCLPGVPLAALLGFTANGDPYNTTGWLAGDEEERQQALARGRRPFKSGDPTKGYGAIGSHDLHELGWYGVEGGRCPTPCATDPECPWVILATSDLVRGILGRDAVTGKRWFGAFADQCAIGVANLRRHGLAVRDHLDERLRWALDGDGNPRAWTLWGYALAMMSWSAGSSGAAKHVNAYADSLAAIPEALRWGAFMRAAAAVDDPRARHRADEYSALRTAQKLSAGRLACAFTGESLTWFDEGLGADRERVLQRLVDVSSD